MDRYLQCQREWSTLDATRRARDLQLSDSWDPYRKESRNRLRNGAEMSPKPDPQEKAKVNLKVS